MKVLLQAFFVLTFFAISRPAAAQETGAGSGNTPAAEQSGNVSSAASGLEKSQPVEGESYPDPNLIPYKSRKSPLVHFFSLPAKIWRLAWTPLGAFMIWAEQNRIHEKAIEFFLNDERTAGFFPLVNFGGQTGFGGGLMIFHNNLFNKGKRINASFLYSSTDNNTLTLSYSDSSLFGTSFYFDFLGEYFNDEDENYFEGGNSGDEESSETSYSTRLGGGTINLGYALHRRVGLGLVAGLKRVRTANGEGEGGDRFEDTGVFGIGSNTLLSIGSSLTLNFTAGWPRTLSGTLLRLSYRYHRQLGGDAFEFNRYTAEVQQFVPLPFLAPNRRLAVRGMLEKVDRINGKEVPFYELSLLGDAANLRGFDQNRFRARGLLLFNIEYRYPVWDTWDAVIFVDEGQVFDRFQEIDFDAFHFSIGTGLRVMSRTGFILRFEIARSSEMVRALFQFTPNF